MSTQEVRVAVIGAGDFGARHIRVASLLPEYKLVAVADRDTERAQIAATGGAMAYSSLREVLGSCELDAVIIATPPGAHLADIGMAVEAGLPVLVEKPVIAGRTDLAALAELSDASRALVYPAHISRFLPGFAALREEIMGRQVSMIRAVRVVPEERIALHGRDHPALAAMVHDLDLVRALVPADLVSLHSEQAWTLDDAPHPQSVIATLRFSDGTIASVENTWTMPHARQYIDARLEVFGKGVTAELRLPAGGLRISDSEGIRVPDVELEGEVYGVPTGALATELRCFARAVRHGREWFPVSLEQAEWSVDVANAIAEQHPGASRFSC